MLEPVIKILELLVSALPKLNLKASRKKVFGKALFNLHYQLTELLRNGDEVIELMRSGAPPDVLQSLLIEQVRLLSRITGIIRMRMHEAFHAILAAYNVYINHYDSAAEEKRVMICMTLGRLEMEREGNTRMYDASNDFADNLGQIRGFAEQLRSFIVDNFQIDDVI